MTFDYFLDTINANQKEIIEFMHNIFLSYPEVGHKMRYRIPFYDHKTWVCYLNPVKPDKVELCFLKGKELSNAQGLLDDRGRKMISGIILSDLKSIPIEEIHVLFAEAIMLGEM